MKETDFSPKKLANPIVITVSKGSSIPCSAREPAKTAIVPPSRREHKTGMPYAKENKNKTNHCKDSGMFSKKLIMYLVSSSMSFAN